SLVLPRIGQEVLVSFMNGDPDQPLVTGTLYNATAIPPHALPTHKTRSGFKSLSTPGGGGHNELRIEDKKGSEQLFVHAEKDASLFVKNDWREHIGHDAHALVQKNAIDQIHGDQHLGVGTSATIKI